MNILLDTHMLLWAAADKLPSTAAKYITDEANTLYFSAASIWETVIKSSLGRSDFQVNPSLLYNGLLGAGYIEMPVTSGHTLLLERLPMIHKDPFDRLLLAQAIAEHCTLLTSDVQFKQYKGPVILV